LNGEVPLKDAASLSVKDALEALETSPKGLTSEEGNRRLTEYGPNMLTEKKRVSVTYKFLTRLKDLFSVLLLFASLLAAIGNVWDLSLIIFAEEIRKRFGRRMVK
jgi:magnesium-transporting ATPase (P-type)